MFRDAVSVVNDGGDDIRPAARQVRNSSAPAVAHHADRPRMGGRVDRRREVRRQTRGVRFQRQREALGCAVGVVGQIHAALLAVEEGRSDRKITLRGTLLSHALDVSSDAEDFLDYDDRTLGESLGPCHVGFERVAIACSQLQIGHGQYSSKPTMNYPRLGPTRIAGRARYPPRP